MATKTPAPSAAPVESKPGNPFFGHGGSYRLDPVSGKTTLIERAGTAAQPEPPVPLIATPSSTPAQE